MSEYARNRMTMDAALRKAGVVVVMNKKHIQKPEDMVITMKAVHDAGLIAEVTFRIDEAILREAMQELVRIRAAQPQDDPFLLGVGSVINPAELESAIEMGFDMIVAPANVMGGHGDGSTFIRLCHEAGIFAAPAVFTPTEFNAFLERPDGLEPDAFKIFPARSHGPKGVGDLLAPFARDRHKGKIVMPTGAVDYETGPLYHKVISGAGFTPVLGMSAPLQLVADRNKPGDLDTVVEALNDFKARFQI